MPNWNKILTEVEASNQVNALDRMRKEYFEIIHRETGRNVISYYSGWLKQPTVHTMIDELDKNAFMSITHSLDKGMGLDIIIHTPGGDLAVMENLINYLHKIFNGDIRVIIPQIAMSAGTMIALFSKAILMGEQSCLGPVDPQYNGVACQAIIDEFEKAKEEIAENPNTIGLWQTLIAKYPGATIIHECENAIRWSNELMDKWIPKVYPNIDIEKIRDKFLNHKTTYSHARRLSKDDCKEVGLNIIDLEDFPSLNDAVLSLHSCYTIMIDKYSYSKIVENQTEYLQPIITQYFIDNKSEIWLLFLIAHSKR